MKNFLGILGLIFILLLFGCSQKKAVAQKEQLLENSKIKKAPGIIRNDCLSKYGNYPRQYYSYHEFVRCEFKEEE